MSQGGLTDAEKLDALFETLSNRERRRLLYYLREHGSATQSELGDVLAGWAATGRDDGATTRADWERLLITLHHVHLPQLQDTGLVDADADTAVVELRELPPWVERCLDAAFESEQELSAGPEQFPQYVSEDNH